MTVDVVAADHPGALDRAATALTAGGLVVLPTDTVYGVAALASDPSATARLFTAKDRSPDQALAVLVADRGQAETVSDPADWPTGSDALLTEGWPGPLTVVVCRRPAQDGEAWALGGDPTTVGVRCPDHDFVRSLAARVGPLATTSANRHGEPTPPDARGAAASLVVEPALVVDGGRCGGSASTVVRCDLRGWQVLRAGGFPEGRIRHHLR